MTEVVVGYARCTADEAERAAERRQLRELGVAEERIYLDRGRAGANPDRPGLRQALAACRAGDILAVTALDRLARSISDARAIAATLAERGIKLSLGGQVYDPANPLGRIFFTALETLGEFEVELRRSRARHGMVVARAKGKLRGRQPKLSRVQQAEVCRMHATGDYSIGDIAEVFAVSRPTVYRTLQRGGAAG